MPPVGGPCMAHIQGNVPQKLPTLWFWRAPVLPQQCLLVLPSQVDRGLGRGRQPSRTLTEDWVICDCGMKTQIFLDVRNNGGKSNRLGRRPGLGFLFIDLINGLEWWLCVSPWPLRPKEWMRHSSFLPVVCGRQTQKKAIYAFSRHVFHDEVESTRNVQKSQGNDAKAETSIVNSN